MMMLVWHCIAIDVCQLGIECAAYLYLQVLQVNCIGP